MTNRELEDEPEPANQKKGMQIPVFSNLRLRDSMLRRTISQQSALSQTQEQRRDISLLGRQLKDLSLNDKPNENSKGGQVVSNQYKQPPSRPSQSEVPTEIITPTAVQQDDAARGNPLGPADSRNAPAPVPATPPESKKFNAAMDTVRKVLQSPCKAPFSPFKLSGSPKKSFLTKDSNVTSFAGWDVDGRLNEFESQFKVMKETFEGTMTDRKVLEEAIDMAKNRGIYPQAASS